MSALWNSIRPLLLCFGVLMVLLTLSRLLLVMLYRERVSGVDALGMVFAQGFRFDLVIVGMLLILPCLLLPVLVSSTFGLSIWKGFLMIWLPLIVMTVLLMELSTPSFAEQFDNRPNVLFFEYFEHPKEVLAMLWGAYRLPLLLGLPLVALAGLVMLRFIASLLENTTPVPLPVAISAGFVLLLIAGMFIRSTTGPRPVNPSVAARTSDTLVNQLPLNSTYTVAYAAYEMRQEDNGGTRYGNMDQVTAAALVRSSMTVKPESFLGPDSGTWHEVGSLNLNPLPRPKNLIIVLQESLGAEFVGALGGLDLTPNIDALADTGLWFENLYATGTRSVRGIEAVLTGFPPTASRSVVKLPKSQTGFFTLASFLSDKGYDTSFIYGGEAHFDNMSRFFMGNGFDRIVEEKDYVNPEFTGTWGVSDEDLLTRAHEEFEKMGDRPFFSLVFSSSNHTPFEYPDGRIEQHDAQKATVNNAVKYADYALGEFLNRARASRYWDDTLILIVADHNSRVYGDALIPVQRFHIPGVIIGGGVEPVRYDRIASQIDLAPTLISMMGITGVSPLPGRDLLSLAPEVPGRAIMQFNAIQAYLEGEELVVLRHDLPPVGFRYKSNQLEPTEQARADLVQKATAYATWAADSYENSSYGPAPELPSWHAEEHAEEHAEGHARRHANQVAAN